MASLASVSQQPKSTVERFCSTCSALKPASPPHTQLLEEGTLNCVAAPPESDCSKPSATHCLHRNASGLPSRPISFSTLAISVDAVSTLDMSASRTRTVSQCVHGTAYLAANPATLPRPRCDNLPRNKGESHPLPDINSLFRQIMGARVTMDGSALSRSSDCAVCAGQSCRAQDILRNKLSALGHAGLRIWRFII